MKTKIILFLFIILSSNLATSQNRISYIKKDTFTKIISINQNSNHGDDFLNINVFHGELDKVNWGESTSIISYRFLGIDNQNNLHIQRRDNDYLLKEKDVCDLIFKMEANKPTEITLIGKNNQKEPLLIKVLIEASNNFIKTKYQGDLPIYNN